MKVFSNGLECKSVDIIDCRLRKHIMRNAMLIQEENYWYIFQNEVQGAEPGEISPSKFGYLYSWFIGFYEHGDKLDYLTDTVIKKNVLLNSSIRKLLI